MNESFSVDYKGRLVSVSLFCGAPGRAWLWPFKSMSEHISEFPHHSQRYISDLTHAPFDLCVMVV